MGNSARLRRSQTSVGSLSETNTINGVLSGKDPSDDPSSFDSETESNSSSDSRTESLSSDSITSTGLSAIIRVLSESVLQAELAEMEMIKAREAARWEAEKRRLEMEVELTRMVVHTHFQATASLLVGEQKISPSRRKRKRSTIEEHESSTTRGPKTKGRYFSVSLPMEIYEMHNSNSPDRLRRDTPNSWSELPPDLLIAFFERLSFTDFRRAKSVCSSWHSASRRCVPKKPRHWLILFPKENNNCCTLFNPEEKDKLYKTQDLGSEFSKSICIATYGNWLIMQDPHDNCCFIVNLFTCEKINLPSHEKCISFPVFWIDDKTKDYVVLWRLVRDKDCVLYSKKGDNKWNQIPKTSGCIHIVFKDYKLYLLSLLGVFKIFDFSGEIPKETIQCGVRVDVFLLGPRYRHKSNACFNVRMATSYKPFLHGRSGDPCFIVATKIVVTVTGQLLKVEETLRPRSGTRSFQIFKIYPPGCLKKHEHVYSLGEETMLLDEGITVRANDFGFISNTIYFDCGHGINNGTMSLFNLKTQNLEELREFDCSSIQFSSARWFLPNFNHT